MTPEPAPDQTDEQTHDYYGVPLWLMKEYLAQLGAREGASDSKSDSKTDSKAGSGAEVMVADGWRAELRKAAPRHLGSLVIGGTTATFTGDAQALAAMFERLHWKTLRGGG